MNKIWILFFLTTNLLFGHAGDQEHGQRNVFIENKGQWPSRFKFMKQVQNGYMWFSPNSFRVSLTKPGLHPSEIKPNLKSPENKSVGHAYELEFIGGKALKMSPSGPESKTLYNFYLGNNRSNWASGARAFEEILYSQLYPGVDLKLTEKAGHLKYDLILNKAEDIQQVKIQYKGLKRISIREGKLRLGTCLGEIEESIPLAWQVINGKKEALDCQYKLNGTEVSFYFPKGIKFGYPLIIDPEIVFYTYSGGQSDNWGSTAVGDRFGNSYLAGTIYGPNFPVTLGAFDSTYNDLTTSFYRTYDLCIQKFNPNGRDLLFSTFLGGNEIDTPNSLVMDNEDNLLILGTTSSVNFPVSTTAFQPFFSGGDTVAPLSFSTSGLRYVNGSDLFVTRLSKEGNALLASTFLGGSGNDGIVSYNESISMNYGDAFRGDIAVAKDGSVLIASHTHSLDFPVFNAFQNTGSGSIDGVVVKLLPDLSNIVWSTYLGGSNMDVLYSIQTQGNDKVVVSGGSQSINFPITENAYKDQITGDRTIRNNFCDAVIASFSLANGNLLHSTFSGSNAYDLAFLVQSDLGENIYIFGQTKGFIPRTEGTFGNDGGKIFLQKFDPNLQNLIWSTAIGNNQNNALVPSAFLVDTCGRIYFSGWGGRVNNFVIGNENTNTQGFPTTETAFLKTSDGSDFYFCVLGAEATSLEYATFFGSNGGNEHVDGGMSRFDKSGVITQAVCGCAGYPGTPGTYSPVIRSGNCNQAVVKINLGILLAEFKIVSTPRCNLDVSFQNNSSNGKRYVWYWGDGDSLVSENRNLSHTYKDSGTYVIKLYASNSSTCLKKIFFFDTIFVKKPFNFQSDTVQKLFCKGDSFTPELPERLGITRTWITFGDIVNDNYSDPIIEPRRNIIYEIENKNKDGCILNSYYQTVSKSDLKLVIFDTTILFPCENRANVILKANANSPDAIEWTIDNQNFKTDSFAYEIKNNGMYLVQLNGIKNTCPDSVSKSIFIPEYIFKTEADFDYEIVTESCSDKYVKFFGKVNEDLNYDWDFGDGTFSFEKNPIHYYSEKGIFKPTLRVKNQTCQATKTIDLDIDPVFIPNFLTSNADGMNDTFVINGLGEGVGLQIFNRWGEKIFETESYQNNWTPNDLNPGTYFFHLKFSNGKTCKSWVEVFR
jgi:gliding motility-associated-like protein